MIGMTKLRFFLLFLQCSIFVNAKHSRHHPSRMHHRTLDEQPVEFGDEHFRIVNGSRARRDQFPWAAALMSRPYDHERHRLDDTQDATYRVQSCGASILSRKFLITAAHCFFVPTNTSNCDNLHRRCCYNYYDCEPVYAYTAQDLKVFVGILSTARLNGDDWLDVERIHIPQNYNRRTLANDVGLLQLSDRTLIQFTDIPFIIPIKVSSSFIYEDTLATICGWGSNCYESLLPSDKKEIDRGQTTDLKYIGVTTTNFNNCSRNDLIYGKNDENVICAGAIDKNVGQGDSGGGLFIRNMGENYLIGVVSTATRCGYSKPGWVPSVFTRLSTFYGWIDNIVNPKSNVDYASGGQDYDTEDYNTGDNNDHYNSPYYMGSYNSPQSMGLWQWIHMYPGLSNGMFPEENGDNAKEPNSNNDDNTIKHKNDFNLGPYGGASAWIWQNPYIEDDDNTIKHKNNFNFNSNINSNSNGNTNINRNANRNSYYGHNKYGLYHNIHYRKHGNTAKADYTKKNDNTDDDNKNDDDDNKDDDDNNKDDGDRNDYK